MRYNPHNGGRFSSTNFMQRATGPPGETLASRRTLHKVLFVIRPMESVVSNDPAAACDALRALGKLKATPERVAEVEAQLDSKFQSVQSVAAQVLAGWKSNKSLPRLRSIFEALQDTNFFAQRSIIAKAMGAVLRVSDTEEIVRWFLSLPTYNARSDLLPTIACVEPKRAKPLLENAWASGDREMKHSILVAASEMRQPWMFIPLGLRDPDGYIRALATEFAKTWGGGPEGR